MNRWETIANQFDNVEGVSLTAVLRNDEVANWSINSPARKKFLDIADEASSQLGIEDRFAWFNHLWKTYRNRFVLKQPVIIGIDPQGGEQFTFCSLVLEDAGRLSARAARDLSDSTDFSSEELGGQDDTKDDTAKKSENSRKTRRSMNVASSDCVRIYKTAQRSNIPKPMKQVVSEYVEKNSGSFDGIMRRLNDNPDLWKDLPKDDK